MGLDKYSRGFEVAQHAAALDVPSTWRKPRLVFVNSMSDLFHDAVGAGFIRSVFDVMNRHPQHTFQVLTKRPERAQGLDHDLHWTPNVWLGTSIESERRLDRLETVRRTSARTKFLSLEPLLGPLSRLDLSGIDWVIAGGESGPGARPMDPDWVRQIRDLCVVRRVPFFFKQWGGVEQEEGGETPRRQDMGPDADRPQRLAGPLALTKSLVLSLASSLRDAAMHWQADSVRPWLDTTLVLPRPGTLRNAEESWGRGDTMDLQTRQSLGRPATQRETGWIPDSITPFGLCLPFLLMWT